MKESILQKWKNRTSKSVDSSTYPKAPIGAEIPLSKGQQRLYFLQGMNPDNSFYNYSESYILKGNLVISHLKLSLQKVFDENDNLRTTFHDNNGSIIQRVNEGALEISQYDLSSTTEEKRQEKQRSLIMNGAAEHFDLTQFPLVRASLIMTHEDEFVLTLTMHHIITDKWSMGLLREQLAAHYSVLLSNNPLNVSKPEIQYTDYAYDQSQQNIDDSQVAFWKNKLAGELPVLNLPVEKQRGSNPDFKGAFDIHNFGPALSHSIIEKSKELEVTPFVFLLSVYYILLYKYSGQTDILVGTPISNRNEKALEKLMGFFNETVVLRSDITLDKSFTDFVALVRQTMLAAFSNKEVSFDVLVKELNPERVKGINPFFQVMFLYHDVPDIPSFGEELEVSHTTLDLGVSKFDLTLYISNDKGQLSAIFEYATDLFSKHTIENFQEHYQILLETLTVDSEQKIEDISMISESENALFFPEKLNKNHPFKDFKGIHEVIAEAAKKDPETTAVVFGNSKINYAELGKASDKCADAILKITKGANEIVGLCADRSIDMIIGLLGILKAGCAYLPLDPEYPSDRLEFMLEDAKVTTILTQQALASNFINYRFSKLYFEEIALEPEVVSPSIQVSEEDLCYVIYTSGSTGKPKGVPIRHKNILASTESRLLFYDDNPNVFLLLSSIAFDSSKAGIFWTLSTGGTLVIGEKRMEQDLTKIGDTIKENGVTHSLMLPSLYNLFLEHGNQDDLESLSTIIVAGEACHVSMVRNHFNKQPKIKLYNEYGPTEATVWCIAHQVVEDDIKTAIPIGKALNHSEVFLLNAFHELVPMGAVGELYIGGAGLAQTYLNRPELTAEGYIDSPFEKGAKLYRTGDLARYSITGTIEYLGRGDHQVKIRGHRIELKEIEEVLLSHPRITEAIVVVEGLNEDNFVLPKLDGAISTTEISKVLKSISEIEFLDLIDQVKNLNEIEKDTTFKKE